MDSTYREIHPSSALAPFVECFWTREIVEPLTARILPDGCADILFFLRKRRLVRADVIGVMTRPHDVVLASDQTLLGIRFHPGMAGACLPCDVPAINDRSAPLPAILGSDFDRLTRGLFDGRPLERQIEVLEERLTRATPITRVQQAIGALVDRKGDLALDDVAVAAGLGQRQLRRACRAHSGLSPKRLARILRFRQAVARLRAGERDMAGVALRCGYCDQSHMIGDFRALAGTTPAGYARQFSG